MPLTEAEHNAFVAHLQENAKDQACPVCRSFNWEVDGPFTMLAYVPATATEKSSANSTAGMPVIVTVCNVCLYMRTYAWLGLFPKPKPEPVQADG